MKNKGNDPIKLIYIAAAAVIGAVVFIALAAGSLISNSKKAQENAGTAVTADSAESAEMQAAQDGTADGQAQVSADAAQAGAAAEADAADSSAAGTGGSAESGDGSTAAAGGTADSAAATTGTVTIKVSAIGDCTLGTDDNFDYDSSFNAYYDDYAGYPAWFFENVKTYLADDDLTIANFEGVLTEEGEREDKEFAFKGRPDFVEVLTEGSVEACNVANNHSGDYGREAYEDTKRILANAGIQVFGYDRSVVVDVNGIKVGLTGTLELYDGTDCLDSVYEEIREVRDQGAQLIICSFHWGDEGEYSPYEDQYTVAHAAIDAGADLVIGHHPHRIQKMEKYNGKYIFYSLGNFCFGGHPGPSDMDSLIAQQKFTFENGVLQEANDDDVRVIPCRISSTSEYNNYQPTPFDTDSEGYARVITKLRGSWG